MVSKVVAVSRGYLDSVLREPGEVFHIADELWADEKRRPRWCREVGAEDAQAEDGEGGEGDGGKPEVDADKPKGKGKGGKGKNKPVTAQAPEADPFADAPAPVRVKNEINDATGGTQPDWLPPSGKAVAVTD
ncbi:hypothetical protein EN742_06545 [Mesorhizobium sp. M4A.F.Ca.ET.020.02.1.1]|uniref:hypothetical protein n=1 Tax=Mesorhizobium sp. M4A.F.Ca.ET.020.02.1.1 TaxID=2496652 RepID=UPI000FD60D1D|nr:hypothetical protein [Mesorhizobium sp. M4A.F.Ca.ET.020.02.1.1]RVD42871.1 hypothetical protein EN742_06545 [Mesorhizobium sp. M4A.F.Ca.ET.020.02.1.1]